MGVGDHCREIVPDWNIDGFNVDDVVVFGAHRPCPSLAIELTEPAISITSNGNRVEHEAGQVVHLDVGQESLKRGLCKADPSPGDLLKITLDGLVERPNGTSKQFEIKIARRDAVDSEESDIAVIEF